MCECIPPPPLFELPPPPDPSLIWRELVAAQNVMAAPLNNITDARLDHEASVIQQLFRGVDSCELVDGNLLDIFDSVIPRGSSFWENNFGGDKNINRLHYLLILIFILLSLGCLAAICTLRFRSNRLRLKNSQRSTPSLNSSKLSTETVGTATATMIASVGSGSRSGSNNVATLLNSGSVGCHKRPQMYHSATISRRTFAAAPGQYYYMQYPQQPLPYLCNSNCMIGGENGGSCCSNTGAACCYAASVVPHNGDAQQRNALRIYSSQSATNIFGNGCLQRQHMQCANASINNSGQLAPHPMQQQQCVNNTLMRNTPRCAALRVQRQHPQLSLVTHPPNSLNDFDINGHMGEACGAHNLNRHDSWQQTQGSYCTLPYEYEEIANPPGTVKASQTPRFVAVMQRETNGFDDTENTTVFEDLSENLRQMEATENQQQFHKPPPATRPPPIPAKRNCSTNNNEQQNCKSAANHWQSQNSSVTYQIPPNTNNANANLISPQRALSMSSSSSVDAELQRLTAANRNANRQQSFDYDDKVEDRTCDDATSLAISVDGNGDGTGDMPTTPINNCINTHIEPPHQYVGSDNGAIVNGAIHNGRESGYGTGKSRKIMCQNLDSGGSPHLQKQKFSVIRNEQSNGKVNVHDNLPQLRDNGNDPQRSQHGSNNSGAVRHIPSMTYV